MNKNKAYNRWPLGLSRLRRESPPRAQATPSLLLPPLPPELAGEELAGGAALLEEGVQEEEGDGAGVLDQAGAELDQDGSALESGEDEGAGADDDAPSLGLHF